MRRLLSLACVVVLGCQPSAEPVTAPAARPAVAAPATAAAGPLSLLDAVGDSAPLTVSLDPGRWATLHGALVAKARALPGAAQQALGRLNHPAVAIGMALGVPPLASAPGLDPKRPWVFALFEPPASGPVGATTALLPPMADGFPGFRHRAALPATDAKALAKAVAQHLGAAGFDARGPVSGRPDSHLLQRGRGWCAVWPSAGHVYVEWVSHVALRPEATRDLAPVGPVGKPARGAAFLAASQPAAVSLRFEARHLRAAYTAYGYLQGVEALASVGDPAIAVSLGRAVIALLAKAEALMVDAGADLNAHALTLDAQGEGVRLVWSAEATDVGHRALAAGAAKAAAPLTVKGEPLAQGTTAFAWAAALEAAQVPARFARVGLKPPELAHAFQECGVGCWWHLLLRAPLGTTAGALQVMGLPGGLTPRDLPTAVQVVVPGPAQLAVAAEIGTVDPGLIRQALAESRPLREAQLHVVPRGDRKALLLGINVDPREVFDVAPAPAVGLGYARVDLARLGTAVPGLPAEAAGAAAALGTLTVRASLTPWGMQQVLDLGPAQAPPLPASLQATPQPPRSTDSLRCPTCTDLGPVPAATQACLARAALGLGGLSALASAAPEQRAAFAQRLVAELAPDVACVAEAKAAQPVAAGLRAILGGLEAPSPTP